MAWVRNLWDAALVAGSTTGAVTPTANATGTNTLILGVGDKSTSAVLGLSVADTLGNTWVRDVNDARSNATVAIFRSLQDKGKVTTSTVITITYNGTTISPYAVLAEYDSKLVLDGHHATDGAAANAGDPGALTTRYASELVVGVLVVNGNKLGTPSSGFTRHEATTVPLNMADGVVGAAGSYDCSWTWGGGTAAWAAGNASYYVDHNRVVST